MATKRIVLLIAITALLIAATAAPALALLSNGQSAPNFSFTDLSGHTQTLSEYRGKVVVIQFFGADCGYCQSDAKDTLVPLYNTYYKNDAKVQFLGVEVDGSAASAIQQYVEETGVTWPVGDGVSAGSAYQVASTPTLYVISPAGNVASSSVYPTNATLLRSTISNLEGELTQLSLSVNNPTPAVGQSATFTATLKSGTTPLSSKSVSIYHYLNGVRYNDATKTTNSAGQITLTTSWASIGTRTYYATFTGDSSHQASTSSVVTVTVKGQTQVTLTASDSTPTVGQSVTFTATLKNGTKALSQSVTIYHYLNDARYSDTTKTTNSAGQITLTTSWASSGTRTYYAVFFGDGSYQSSTSSAVFINVGATKITLTASNSTPAVGQSVNFTATLTSGTTLLSGKNVTIYHYLNDVRYNDTTKTTDKNGQISLTTSWSTAGERTYYATFAGNSSYQASTSAVVKISV
ncbi:MAG: Ig-like domain repeat protein [Halobacteriota archaeon]